jgi:hypothetical protein
LLSNDGKRVLALESDVRFTCIRNKSSKSCYRSFWTIGPCDCQCRCWSFCTYRKFIGRAMEKHH